MQKISSTALTRTEPVSPIRTLRQEAGLTQAQLAASSGVNVRQIQKLESGEIDPANMSLANAVKLAAVLGVQPADLLG